MAKYKYGKGKTYVLNDKDKKDLIEEIREKWENGKKKRALKELNWTVNLQSYRKSDRIYYIDSNNRLREQVIKNTEQLDEMRSNTLFPIIRSMDAQLRGNRPMFRADITNFRIDDFDARTQQAMAVKKYDKWEDEGMISQQRIYYITTGNVGIKQFFNFKEGKLVQLAENEIIPLGKIGASIVTIFDFVADDSMGNFNGSAWCIHRISMKKKIADVRFKGFNLKPWNPTANTLNNITGEYYNSNEEYSQIFEYYAVGDPDSELPEGMLVQTDLSQILYIGESPAPKNEEDIRALPFKWGKAVEMTDIEGDTPLTYARSDIKKYTARMKQLNEYAKMSVPVLNIDKRAKFESNDLTATSGKITVVRSDLRNGKYGGWSSAGELGNTFILTMNLLKQNIGDICGTKPFQSLGTRTPAQSLGIQKAFNDMDNAGLVENFYKTFEQALNQYLDFERDYGQSKGMVEYYDGEDYIYADYIGKNLKKGIKVKLSGTFGLSSHPIIRQGQLEKLLAMGVITSEEFKGWLQFGEFDKVFVAEMWDKIRAAMENDCIIRKDKTPSVDVYENHLVHIEKHILRLRKSDMFMYPDATDAERKLIEKRRTKLYVHIEFHWYALAKLINSNILQAGMVLGIDTMNPRRAELFKMALQQIATAAQATEEKIAKMQNRKPEQLNMGNFENMAKGVGASSPELEKLKKLQSLMDSNMQTDMISGMGGEQEPQPTEEAQGNLFQ